MTALEKYLIANNLDTIPKCPICGNELKFISSRKGFTKTCSTSCGATLSAKFKTDNQKRYDALHGPGSCKVCGKPTKFNRTAKCYMPTCSVKCGAAYRKRPRNNDEWPQDRYDREHNLTPSNRPTCKICGKPVKFKSYNDGYRTTCSRSCASILQHKNGYSRKSKKSQAAYDKLHNITANNRPMCPVCGKQAKFVLKTYSYNLTCSKSCSVKSWNSRQTNQHDYDSLHNIKERPKCSHCNNEAFFISINKGYSNTCGNTLCMSAVRKSNKYAGFNTGILRGTKSCVNKPKYRSSYEKCCYINFERLGILYKVEPFKLHYIGPDNKQHTYTPDILLPQYNIVAEIKPTDELNNEWNILKHEALLKYCKSAKLTALYITEKHVFDKVALHNLINNASIPT